MTMAGSATSALLLGFSFFQIALIVWTVFVAAALLFVIYVVFFLDNIKGRNYRLPTDEVLRILREKLLPVTFANGWRLSSFANGVSLWRRTLSKDALNDSSASSTSSSSSAPPNEKLNVDLCLCASYTLCHATPSAVWESLKSLSKNLQWNPHLQYLQRYPQPDGDKADARLPHPTVGRDHVMEGSWTPSSRSLSLFNRVSSRLLGEAVFKQLSVFERWWWRPDSGDDDDDDDDDEETTVVSPPSWLLTNDTQRLAWTFYCVEPVFFETPSSPRRRRSSWVTIVTCCDRRLTRLTEEVVSTRLASLASYVSLSAVAASTTRSLVSGPKSSNREAGEDVALFPTSNRRRGDDTGGDVGVGDSGGVSGNVKSKMDRSDLRGRSATLPAHWARRSTAASTTTNWPRSRADTQIHHRDHRRAGRPGSVGDAVEDDCERNDFIKHLRSVAESKHYSTSRHHRMKDSPTRSLPSRVGTSGDGDTMAIPKLYSVSAVDSSLSISDEGVAGDVLHSGADAADADASDNVGKDGSASKSSPDPPAEPTQLTDEDDTVDDPEGSKTVCKSPLEMPPPVDEVAYHVIANQAAADLMAEVLRVSVIDLSSSESRQRAETGGWCFSGIEKDVVILRKSRSDEDNLVSILGKGIIPVEPEVVCNTLKNPHSRFMYDEQLKKLKILHEFASSPTSPSGSSDLKVLHMFHEVTHMLRRYTRDICAIQGYRREGRNHLLTMRSVVWPSCPEDDRQPSEKGGERPRRITLLPSGWVIEPISRVVDTESDANGIEEDTIGVASMVSYLIQVDLGTSKDEKMIDGWIDLVKKQPLGIAHLRQYLVPSQVSDVE